MSQKRMDYEGNLLYVKEKVIKRLEVGNRVLSIPPGYGIRLSKKMIYPGIERLEVPLFAGVISVYNRNFPSLSEVFVEEGCKSYATDGKSLYDETGKKLINAFSLAWQEELSIREGVEVLGERSCSGGLFRKLSLPSSLVAVEEGALEESIYSLQRESVLVCGIYLENHVPVEELHIPEEVREVKGRAFSICCPRILYTHVLPSLPSPFPGRLEELCLTDEQAELAQESLLSWAKRVKVSFPRGHFRYEIREEGIYDKTTKAFLMYTPCMEKPPVIQEGTKIIAARAFYKQEHLSVVYLPDSIEVIGEYAFAECDCLETVQRSIYAFRGGECEVGGNPLPCSFPRSLKRIEREAFYGCDDLLVDSLPESLTFLGKSAFEGSSYWGRTAESLSLPASLSLLEQNSLPGVEQYYKVCMGTAKGLIMAMPNLGVDLKLWDPLRGDYPGMYKIWPRDKEEISEKWDQGMIAVNIVEKMWKEHLYRKEERLDVSFFLCLNGWDETGAHREYLKKNGVQMGKLLLEEGREEEFCAFLKADILTTGNLEKLREAADEMHKVEMVAEILDAKERIRPKKVLKDFKL